MFILADCNNFFASCEQVFRPDWRRKPVVVLSNNDGCVISRSPEAKKAGIAMGEPFFRCKERLAAMGAVVCSANFSLYSDLSDRVMGIIEESLPEVQQYSIDEAFAEVEGGDIVDWEHFCRRLRAKILRWTGLTVSIGMAPTRTLCKLANETAKHTPAHGGVLLLTSPEHWMPLLAKTPVEDVWGVGRRLKSRMHELGIRTAAGLAACPLKRLRRHFGVHGERLALELQGISCLAGLEETVRTQVMVSRSLKEGITQLPELRDVLCRFVEKAGGTLRANGLMASAVYVVLRISRFATADSARYAADRGAVLPYPTDDTRVFTRCAAALLESIFREGFEYKKIGVLLARLQAADSVQPTFEHPDVAPSALMGVLDKLRESGHSVHFANHSDNTPWHRDHVSRCYTTSWTDIPEAR